MNEFTLFLLITNLVLVLLLILLLLLREGERHHIEKQKRELERRLYEIWVLNSLIDRIGYSLTASDFAETIVNTVGHLFSLSSVSYAILDGERIILKTYIKEAVGPGFVQEVRKIMLSSIFAIQARANAYPVVERLSGFFTQEETHRPRSYFNLPLFIHKQFIGLLNISSKTQGVYQEKDMALLYKIVVHFEHTIDRVQQIIETEKGKLNSMLFSLSSGALMFLVHDGEFRLSMLNQTAKRLLNLRENPSSADVFQSFGQALNLHGQINEVLKTKKPLSPKEIEIAGRNLKVFLNPVFLHTTDRVIGVSITMEDVTLETQLGKMRENFTHIVVHELRAPLTSVRGAIELILSQKLSEEDKGKMFALIQQSIDMMLSEVGSLLDAAKMQAGHFQLVPVIGNINTIVKERVEAFGFLAETKHLTVVVEYGQDIPLFEFDRVRINQVLNNLISNSIKFTPSGGSIAVATNKEDGRVKVGISDTGIGIPKDQIPFLFSKFTQLSYIPETGTGLGLYISKGIVESHGGKIWLESEEGKGTKVFFTLPLKEVEGVVAERAVPSALLN